MSKYKNLPKEKLLEIVEQLEEELKDPKKYGLFWDKEKVVEKVVADCENNLPVLKRIKSKEIETDDSEDNILIEGDNYHALNVLNYTHKGKIDVIYIDPPYNQGKANEWRYNDKYIDDSDGYRHSKWLNMMEKRLQVAKLLLKKDGLILISIDDYEAGSLRLLCNKIFNENNFYAQLTWINRTKPKNMGEARFNIQQNTEYILVYGKQPMTEFRRFNLEKLDAKKYEYKDKIGRYRLEPIAQRRNIGRLRRDTMVFPALGILPQKGYRWQLSKDKYELLVSEKRIIKKGDKLFEKIYEKDEDNFSYKPFWSHLLDTGTAEDGKKQLNEILGFEHGFETVKPKELIKKILFHFPFIDNKGIVLDFFAGSGTTGHAVLELNKEDGGNRKFILCTNNEGHICEEITYPRIKSVINGYTYIKNKEKFSIEGLGGNLQYFKTDFVKNTTNRDQLKINLTKKCTEVLCVKENIFNLEKEKNNYKIFTSNDKKRHLCIYYNFIEKDFDNFVKDVAKLDGKKAVYIFALDNKIDRDKFKGIKDISFEAIPYKILEVYEQLVKISKK